VFTSLILFNNSLVGYSMKNILLLCLVFVSMAFSTFAQWQKCEKVISDPLLSLSICDSLNILASGGDGTVIRTTDGGKKWTIDTLPTIQTVHQIITINKEIALAFTRWGGIFRTKDSGKKWNKVSDIDLGGDFLAKLVDDGNDNSILFGVSNSSNSFYKSIDSGSNWTLVGKIPTGYELTSLKFIDNEIGYVCGNNGILLKTSDGGESWEKIARGLTSHWLKQIIVVDSSIFIVGVENGTWKSAIYGSLNGDDNWKVISDSIGYPTIYHLSYSGKYWWISALTRLTMQNNLSLFDNSNFYLQGEQIQSIDWLDTTGIGFLTTSTGNIYKTTNHGLLSTGIQENTYYTFHIYPNPTSSHVIIDCGDNTEVSTYSYTITNSLGQERLTSKFTSRYQQIDISGIGGTGLYIITIKDGNNTVLETRKLLIQ
jgi:photosystem II stability/assembly factor-like uncharacterized protein